MRLPHSVAVFALVGAMAPSGRGLIAQTPSTHARIIGVFDGANGAALPEVQVVDQFTGAYTATNVNGAASLGFLTFRGDTAVIELRKIGYSPVQLAIVRSDTMPITQLLDRFVSLPASVTTDVFRVDLDAGLRQGFERRCAVANASCLRSSDFARRPASSLGDIIGDSKDMLVGRCGTASPGPANSASKPKGCMLMMKSPFGPCTPRFLVNGFPWDQRVLGPPIDGPDVPPGYAPFGPSNVDGIEIYPPERPVPARFGRQPGCGVIVIWTK